MSKSQNYFKTGRKCYTMAEAMRDFYQVLTEDQFDMVVNFICIKDLARDIDGFEFQDGVLFVDACGKMMSVTKKID